MLSNPPRYKRKQNDNKSKRYPVSPLQNPVQSIPSIKKLSKIKSVVPFKRRRLSFHLKSFPFPPPNPSTPHRHVSSSPLGSCKRTSVMPSAEAVYLSDRGSTQSHFGTNVFMTCCLQELRTSLR